MLTKSLTFLCVLMTHVISGYLQKSTLKYEAFFSSENSLLDGLSRYIHHETDRLQAIKATSGYEDEIPLVEDRIIHLSRFYTQAKENASNVSDDERSLRGRHPTSTLVGIRDFVAHWTPLLRNETRFGYRLQEFLNVSSRNLPHSLDVGVLQEQIINLQVFYNLSARDIYNGDILGKTGAPLSIKDAYEIGIRSSVTTHLRHAAEWYELVIEENKKVENKTNIRIPQVLAKLARIYSQFGKQEEAVALAEEAYTLDDEDKTIYQQYAMLQSDYVYKAKNFDEIAPPYWTNFTRACQSNVTFQTPLKWFHRCRLRCSPIPIKLYREEILSMVPYVSVFYDVISDEVINDVKQNAAKTQGPKEDKLHKGIMSSNIFSEKDGAGRHLSRLASDVSGLDASCNLRSHKHKHGGSTLQVHNFGFCGQIIPHHPNQKVDFFTSSNGRKLAEVIFYLTDVEVGGATVFPDIGIRYQPRKGSALLRFTVKPNGERETLLTTAECPMAFGEKWTVTKDIYAYHNRFDVRPCAKKMRGNQIGVDRAVHKFRQCGF